MLGKGHGGGGAYVPEMNEALQSIISPPLDSTEKKGLPVAAQLPGNVQAGPQLPNQLLLTPASLQLAQLQAQLTLHRLKLAQGGNAANAASVLNQLISNVNMSQPLLNQLRSSSLVKNPPGAFPTGVIGFPSSNSAVGSLVGGAFNQNSGNVQLDHACGGAGKGQQGGEYGKNPGSTYSSDTDRRLQYSLSGGTSADGQYAGIKSQAKNMTNVGFHRDFYGHELQGQPVGFSSNEPMNSTAHKEQWKSHNNLNQTGKVNLGSNPPTAWPSAGQPIWSRTELYNPEEPTPEPKLNCSGVSSFGSSGTQGFGSYQNLHGGEETLLSGTRTLQAHQVSDFYGITPSQLPHQCSICEKKVYNLKDWDQHVKGKLHLQNQTLYATDSSAVAAAGAPQYAVGRLCDGGLNPGGTNPTVGSTASQDVSSGTKASYLPAAAMKTYPTADAAFAPHQPESKPFPPRKTSAGRVVHICNLPEGSCTENDVINLGIPFGKVTNYILMRSTHQAFLEMAYVEAAQAMVQYYQLTPATINGQKLLIRMSKRYKELQLKKPGKDVQSIIQDITSQRERDKMQELEHYLPDRARSRSPISRSLSPHSHSPSFTSCSSAHSPPAAPCRGQDRGSNGLSPHRGSRDWPPHLRRGEDERERDGPWRNGSGGMDDSRPNGRTADRWKSYHKHLGHLRSADERGSGEATTTRSSRDWHPRDSPLGSSFNSYRSMDEDFSRASHYRHDAKPRRRDGDHPVRSRHSEFETTDEPRCRTPEDKRRSKNPSRGHAEKQEREAAPKNTDTAAKEKSALPQQSNKSREAAENDKDRETENVLESAEDTDEECWYPRNMEELVTVDEVGGEDDCILEPDLSELEEFTSCRKEPTAEQSQQKHTSPSTPAVEEHKESGEKPKREDSVEEARGEASASEAEKAEDQIAAPSTETEKVNLETTEQKVSDISGFPSEEFKAALEETCLESVKLPNNTAPDEPMENHVCLLEDGRSQEETRTPDKIHLEVQLKDFSLKREIEAPSSSLEQDKAVSEHSIPLGVEFIEPRTGFYCKLCGLFYSSEDTAKTTHCRSTVHYRNLQKYLSQLAENGLSSALAEPSAAH
ncbi:RNA-binding protein 20 isoform X2 [Poecilia formosa]|uniref:RNA binding motif protein 20 n=1 Tax=Poecilia formosa TaxID=48698 RepID=A0A087XGF6_POEFO|nr:PREDICTED: RNA-binding protein 20 isoform X2 [Poecilia formosa]XP_016534917.1 PREDICTED: RNA-binding protein 20 isoform X2 [Poecilia formosa]